ncbi:MAG: PRC-barrel domain-containing protein [DPANN group archaeon]|nr:PRC-barrel domain-containing protein [DPANN group archaeon]
MNRVSDIYGRRIYNQNSEFVGTAKDLLIEPETGNIKYLLKAEAESIFGRDAKEAKNFARENFIPFTKIIAISDIIIIK